MIKRSRPIAVQFYIDEEEQDWLNSMLKDTGASISDYVRDKLFYENKDLESLEERYVVPSTKKHNMINTTLHLKTIQLIKHLLYKQGCNDDEINQIDKLSIEYAKSQRAKNGYDILGADNQAIQQS